MASLSSLYTSCDERQIEQQDPAHGPQRDRTEVASRHHETVEGSEGELAEQHRVGVEVDVAGVARHQDHAEREQRREDQPDGGVLGHQP